MTGRETGWMAGSEFYVGLDVGTTKVLCVVAQTETEGGLRLVGVGRSAGKGLQKGMVADIELTAEAIKKAVKQAESLAAVRIHSAVIGVTGNHVSCRNEHAHVAITTPDYVIGEVDIERVMDQVKAVDLPGDREVLHVIAREFTVDDQHGIKRPQGMSGKTLGVEAHLVTGAVTALNNIRAAVSRAGLGIDDLVLEPIATAESVLNEEEKEIGVAVVDVGGGTSDVAVFYEGAIIHSGVVPIGGNHFTRDLQIGLQTSFDEAERIKRQHGVAMQSLVKETSTFSLSTASGEQLREVPTQKAAYILEARSRELLKLALKEIHKSRVLPMLSAGVVFTGGGSQIRGMDSLARSLYEVIPIRMGLPSHVTSYAADLLKDPGASTGIGLVLYSRRNWPARGLDTSTPKKFLAAFRERLRSWFFPSNRP